MKIEQVNQNRINVGTFMTACDQKVRHTEKEMSEINDSEILLRIKIQIEELNELRDAINDNNKVEIADALADNLYIILGTMNAFNINKITSVNEMSHIAYRYGHIHIGNDKMINDYLNSAFDSIITLLVRCEFNKLQKPISEFIYAIYLTGTRYGITPDILDKAFNIVHESNMTKVMPDGKVLKNEIGKVIKPEGYKPPVLSVLFEG